MLNTLIFLKTLFVIIKNICPQSVLKYSVVHFQGIGMKFRRFFFQNIFLKICQKMRFRESLNKGLTRAWQGLDKGLIRGGSRYWNDIYFIFLFLFSLFFHLFSFFLCVFFLLFVFFCSFLFLCFCLFCFFYFFCFFVFFNFRFGLGFVFFCFFVFFKLRFGLGFVFFDLVLFFLVHFIFLSFYRSCL